MFGVIIRIREDSKMLITASKGRGCWWEFSLTDKEGNTLSLGENDVVRIVIDREGDEPSLIISSASSTTNGSRIERSEGGKWMLRLDGSDLKFAPGVYRLMVEYFDKADESEWKSVDKHVFRLESWEE